MLVGGLILRSTFGVLRETTFVLLDSVPRHVDFGAVGNALARVPGIVAVHDLHVWTIVPGRPALSAHVLVENSLEWPLVLHRARRMLEHDFDIDHVTLQPEWLRRDAPARVIPVERCER
jgi:cobalt-zinc-cadmium efflux system protein